MDDMKLYHNPRDVCGTDYGPEPFVGSITAAAKQNQNFRIAYWTGNHLQMTLMNIPVRGDIGVEMHPDTDQYIRIESGQALVRMGECRENLCGSHHVRAGDGVFVPRGTWHNIINTGSCPLKLSSIYAPPQHPRGTIHRTKADTV
jgi:mannose-6-phosphate isomerase-like protein (cupin superfamily)